MGILRACCPALLVACGGHVESQPLGDAGTAPVDATVVDAPAKPDAMVDSGSPGIDAGPCGLSFGTSTMSAPAGYFVTSIVAADVSGDNRDDLVITAEKNTFGFIYVWTQTQQGTLAGPDQYAATPTIGLLVFDATGDGKNDVVIAANNGLAIYEQSAGKLKMPVLAEYDASATGERGIASGLFDTNKLLDVVEPSSFGIEIWTQSNPGSFADNNVASWNMPVAYARPAVGDVTGDGFDDLVMGDPQKGTVVVFGQTGPRSLGAPTSYPYANFGIGSTDGLAVGDVTGDGHADVVVSHGGNNPNAHVSVLQQKGYGLAPRIDYPSLDIPAGAHIADIDCDGRNDVVVTHPGWLNLGIYRQNANGTLDKEILFKAQTGQNGGNAVGVGDLNGDKRPDIVAMGNFPTDLVLFTSQ